MTKQDIIDAANEIKAIIANRTPSDQQVSRLVDLKAEFGKVPAIEKLFNDDYDRKAINPGWGAPNCSCHISPPCQACVDFTNEQGNPTQELESGAIYTVQWHGGNTGDYIAVKSQFGHFQFNCIEQPDVFVGCPHDAETITRNP